MKTPYLIDVPKTAPSRHDKLKAFKAKHHIETNYCRDVEGPWMACHMPSARKFGYGVTKESTLMECVMHVGRLMDEAGVTDYGQTEREAIRRVCENMGIPCDL